MACLQLGVYARRRDQARRDAWWTWFTSTYDLQATLFLDETAKDPRAKDGKPIPYAELYGRMRDALNKTSR